MLRMSNRCIHIDLLLRAAAALVVLFIAVNASADDLVGPPAPDSTPPATQSAESTDDATTHPAEKAAPKGIGSKLSLPKNGGLDSRNVMSELLATIVVVAVIGGVAWFVLRRLLPKFRMAGPKRNIRVVETTFINPRQSVVLLEVGKKRLLLAATRERISMLADVTDAQSDEAFARTLKQADDQLDTEADS